MHAAHYSGHVHRAPAPLQILSYLEAKSGLCELGYEEAQVEEALEMFQNSESKVRPQSSTPARDVTLLLRALRGF